MSERIYLSGAITGNKNSKEHFQRIAEKMSLWGYTVINPFALNENRKHANYKDYISFDLQLLLTCDIIYMLTGWKESKGANAEYAVAKAVGMIVSEE